MLNTNEMNRILQLLQVYGFKECELTHSTEIRLASNPVHNKFYLRITIPISYQVNDDTEYDEVPSTINVIIAEDTIEFWYDTYAALDNGKLVKLAPASIIINSTANEFIDAYADIMKRLYATTIYDITEHPYSKKVFPDIIQYTLKKKNV